MSKLYISILKDTDVLLWGLTGEQRLRRMFSKHAGVEIIEDISELPANTTVLLLRADYLFDPRLLQALLTAQEEFALFATNSEQVSALRAKSEYAQTLASELLGESEKILLLTLTSKQPADLISAYDPRLLKYDAAEILPINEENKDYLENEIFDASYKGITDFVTKWLWPVPARAAVKWCVRYGFSPNQVTLFSLILTVLAGVAFWQGHFIAGLAMGWFMTFLDTVDGKLARVTITSSKIGDILDHGLDLIHPPLWYLAWGFGIADTWMSTSLVMPLFWIVLGAYIGGRFCEGAFELWIAPFRLFLWRPWDSFNRLITARRNPNLVILSLSLVFGRPDIGLYLVVIWHIISTLVLALRMSLAFKEKRQNGELTTWLNNIDPQRDRQLLEVRVFTRLSKTTLSSKP
ncbi:MAG: phosphatidylglycerophosphate synthase [Gammaproteobacteria bacterium]|jgi:phosphatidylglycerophosphate synthase